MDPRERWSRIEALFQSALEVDAPRRAEFLDAHCADDPTLRSEVESLLVFTDSAHGFLETPVLARGTIGPYRLIRVVASGGMGVVYEAEQRNPRRVVAVKVIKNHDLNDDRRALLFRREIASLARLRHPNIASILEAGQTEQGQLYFAMEFVRGEPITQFAAARDWTIRQRLELFRNVCDAIGYAHQRGVIHRDLKPSNILVSQPDPEGDADSAIHRGPVVKILDFGVARISDPELGPDTTITGSGQVLGTLRYMSPEQTRAHPDEIDVRTDVYSLGVVLYELLTGRLPYETDVVSPHLAMKTICEQPPVRPGAVDKQCRGDLETIVLKALEKDPADRYQGIAEFHEDVNRYLNNLPIRAHPPSSLYQLKKLIGRHRAAVAVASVIFLLTLTFAVVAGILATRLAREHRAAVAAKDAEAGARAVSDRIAGFLEDMFASAHPDKARGREVSVREVIDAAAVRVDSELANMPEVSAAVHDTIGKTYHSLGLYDRAEEEFRAALKQRRAIFDAEHPDVISSMNNLAMLLVDKGQFDEARRLCERALDLARRVPGRDSLVAGSLSSLGSLLRATGDLEQSERCFREALRLRRRELGDKHRDVATCLNNLAALLQQTARFDEAETLYRDALAMRLELLGNPHPDVAVSMNNLAMLYWEQGRYDAAEPLFRQVIDQQRSLVGNDHPMVAAALNNLGLVRKAKGDFAAAESLFRQALDIQRRVLGPDHSDLAETTNNLGVLFYARGDLEGARSFLEDALAIRRRALGNDHPGVAKNLNDLAALHYASKDYDAAEPLYLQALEMYTRLVGPSHPLVGAILNNLGALTRAQGQLEQSEAYYRRSIDVFTEVLPADHPHLAGSLAGLGRTLLDAGKASDAATYLRRALSIQRASLPADSTQTVLTEKLLAECLVELSDFEGAEAVLRSSHRRLLSALGPDDATTISVRTKLQKLYDRTDKPELAAKLIP